MSIDIFDNAPPVTAAPIDGPTKDRGKIATRLVDKGLWLFPIGAGSKKPAHNGWQQEATRDLQTIHEWISAGYNLGIFTGKFGIEGDKALLAIDVDCGAEHGDKDGHATLEALRTSGYDFPETFTQSTPSGGRHLLYVVPQPVKQDVRGIVLGAGLDLKSRGNYVLAAGSTRNGSAYKIENDREIAPAPEWLYQRCTARDAEPAPADVHNADPASVDQSRAEEVFRAYLKDRAPHAQSGNRNATVNDYWATWAKHIGLGDQYQVASIILEAAPWDGEPLDYAEILRTVQSNYQAAAIGYGDWPDGKPPVPTIVPSFEDLTSAPVSLLASPTPTSVQLPTFHPPIDLSLEARGRWIMDRITAAGRMTWKQALLRFADGSHPLLRLQQLIGLSDVKLRDAPIWLIRDWLPARGLAMMYGESSGGKTAIGVDMAMSVADGSDWQGQYPLSQGAVLYAALENPDDTERRFLAARKKRNLTGADDLPLYIYRDAANLASDNSADTKKLIGYCDAIAEVHGQPVSLVVIDTLAYATPGADDNTSKDMGKFLARCNEIRNSTGATVLFIHHPGKNENRGARGSYAIFAGVDTELTVKDHAITVTKQRSGAIGIKARFNLEFPIIGKQQIGDADEPMPVTGVTVVWDGEPGFEPVANDPAPTEPAPPRLSRNNRKLLALIQDMSLSGTAPFEEDVRTEFGNKHYPGGTDRTVRQAFNRALENLVAYKLVLREPAGAGRLRLKLAIPSNPFPQG